MSAADDGRRNDDEGGRREGPVLVLPATGPTSTEGLSFGAGTVTGVPILPEPVVADGDPSPPGGLAERLERRLAEDGRFARLLPALSVATDEESGRVTLAGPALDPDLLPFLLTSLRAVPGVTAVEDRTG